MEKIWKWTFENKLFVLPEDQPIVLTEPYHSSKKHREQLAEVYFESLKASRLWINKCCVLGLYSEGRTTGMVADMGHCGYSVTPVYEGYMLPNASTWSPLGGDWLTNHMRSLLLARDKEFSYDNPRWDGRAMAELKEKWVSTAPSEEDFLKDAKDPKEKIVVLPDGCQITLRDETIAVGEVLFKPSHAGVEHSIGLHEEVFRCIMACENEIRKELWNNILLIGGTSLIRGAPLRLQKEMTSIAPSTVKVNIISPPDRK